MGSSTSKVAKTAAGAAKRQYPQRVPQANNAPPRPPAASKTSAPSQTVHPRPQARGSRDEAINLDASDPDFARALRSIGPVDPQSNYASHSSSSPESPRQGLPGSPQPSHAQVFPDPSRNPAIQILTAREKLAHSAEEEFAQAGRIGHSGRQFLDVVTIRQILMLRDERNVNEGEIEKRLGLKKGIVAKLGPKGVVGDTNMGGM